MAIKEVLHTDLAPAAVGPYSQAIAANGFVFTSGQVPIDEVGQDCSNHHRGADRAGYEESAVRSGTGRRRL